MRPLLAAVLAGTTALAFPAHAANHGARAVAAQHEPLDRQERNFMAEVALAAVAEMRLGRKAMERAEDPAVRAYAGRRVEAHAAALERLRAIARHKGVTLPATLPPSEADRIGALEEAGGGRFDRGYMNAQEETLARTLKFYEASAQELDDPELRAFAADALPALRHEQQAARDVMRDLAGRAARGG